MADVKWIKIATDIFNNKKIRIIESMPEGDSIIVIWFKILMAAGIVNDDGNIYFTKEIPYTDQMLSTVFNRPLTTIQLALRTFEQFGMIEIVNDVIHVSNWEKYQNVDGLEKVREQTRLRVSKHRQQKKLECNVTSNVTVTQGNAIDIDKEIDIEEDKDIDKEKDIDILAKRKPEKHIYGEYNHVRLTDDEYQKLCTEYGDSETGKAIRFLDEYIEMKGYKAKSHYLCIRKWVFDALKREKPQEQSNRVNKFLNA